MMGIGRDLSDDHAWPAAPDRVAVEGRHGRPDRDRSAGRGVRRQLASRGRAWDLQGRDVHAVTFGRRNPAAAPTATCETVLVACVGVATWITSSLSGVQ